MPTRIFAPNGVLWSLYARMNMYNSDFNFFIRDMFSSWHYNFLYLVFQDGFNFSQVFLIGRSYHKTQKWNKKF